MSKRNNWKQIEKELKTEIERLTEQVELLTSEVETLKKVLVTQNTIKSEIPEYHKTPSPIVKSDTSRVVKSDTSGVVKICQCKGQCSTKRCGCVKGNKSCNELCECNSGICQNKKNDKEQNKENLDNNEVVHIEDKQTSNKNFNNVARRRGLFSVDTPLVSSTPKPKQYVLSSVKFKSPIDMSKSDLEEGTLEQLTRTINDQEMMDNFNPMKPKHQLARTPTKDTKFLNSHTGSSSLILTPDTIEANEKKTTTEQLQVFEEHSQPDIDWEKYQAQLVPCNKCKRKFHPNRIEKHQKCCKKV